MQSMKTVNGEDSFPRIEVLIEEFKFGHPTVTKRSGP